MLSAAANPTHVLTPRDVDLDMASRSIRWRKSADCKTCGGSGTFRWYSPGSRDLASVDEWKCLCDEQTVLHWWMAVRGINHTPQTWAWADVAASLTPRATVIAGEVLDNPTRFLSGSPGLFITSPVGSGKTFVATLLLKHFLHVGRSGCYRGINSLIETLANWRDQEALAFVRKMVFPADVLVIDDLGSEKQKDLVVNPALDEILSFRQDSGLFTIILSEFTPSDIESRYARKTQLAISEMEPLVLPHDNWHHRWAESMSIESRNGLSRPVVFG